MSITCKVPSLVAVVALLSLPTIVQASPGQTLTATSGGITVSVVDDAGKPVALRIGFRGRPESRLPLHLLTASVLAVALTPDERRIVVVGSSGVGGTVEVFEIAARKAVHFALLYAPSLSPNGDFVAGQRFYPRNDPAPTTDYLLLPLQAPSQLLRTAAGQRFYPQDDAHHDRMSDLQWVRPNTCAFLDFAGGVTSVVAVQVGAQGRIDRLAVTPLDTDTLVHPGAVDSDKSPALAIHDATMTDTGEPGLVLRLHFPASPALTTRRADVEMWR